VERKIASSETISVRRPYGYSSSPKPIQQPNQMIEVPTRSGIDVRVFDVPDVRPRAG